MAAPTYDPYLQFNPTFKYGRRSWGANDMDAFKQLLRKRGRSYDRWARNHANAAKVFDPVEQQMYGAYKPQLDALNYERQKAEAAGRRRMGDLAGFTQAIMGMLGEISPAVRGAYGEGAETMQAGGTGFGDVLNRDTARTAAAGNSLLDVLGSGQRIEGGDAGGVLAGLAGWLPADMMEKQGGAYGDMYAQLPKEASFQAQIEMKHLLADAAETDDDFSSEIKNILSGMGATREEFRSARTEAQLAQQEFKLKQIEADRDFWLQQQALYLQQGKMKLAAQAEKRAQQAQQRYNYESQGRDSNGDPMPGYTVNPKTGTLIPPGYRVDKQGNVVKQSSASGSGKGGQYTPGQKQDMMKALDAKSEDIAKDAANRIKTRLPGMGPFPNEKKVKAEIARNLFKEYAWMAPTPQAKKLLRRIIAKAMRGGGGDTNSGSLTEGLLP